jgi:hypothetical protein
VESYYSSNGDGRISPGEAVDIEVTVANNTSESMDDAEIHIIAGTDQTYSVETSEVVAAGEAVAVQSVYAYSDSESTDTLSVGISFFEIEGDSASIPLQVRLVESRKTKSSKNINVELTQTAANMTIGSYTITSDTNDDGAVNPGETVEGSLNMVNTGSGETQGIEWNISLVSGPASFPDGYTYTGSDYSVGVDDYATDSVRFEVAPDAEVGDNVVLEAWILEETGRVWTDTIKIPVQASNGRMVIQGYELTSGDGIPTAGESEYLKLQVENTGTSSVPGVTGFLSSGSEYVTVSSAEQSSYYGVDPGETWLPEFLFEMSEDMPTGHEMSFYLTMEDDLGNIYTDSFSITEGSGGISLSLDSTDVRQVTGDGDDRVEPGESFYVDIEVGNDGGVRANGVNAALRVSDSHIDLSDTSESMGVIQPGESSEASGAFRFLVLASHPGGWVDFEVELTSGSMTFNETFRVQVH